MKNYIVFKTNEKCCTIYDGHHFADSCIDWEKANLKPNTTYVLWMPDNSYGVFVAVKDGYRLKTDDDNGKNGYCLSRTGKWIECSVDESLIPQIVPKEDPKKAELRKRIENAERELQEARKELDGLK